VIHKVQYYDIRKKCGGGNMCYNFANVEMLLNMVKVKSGLGVKDGFRYNLCSVKVQAAMLRDMLRNLDVGIPGLLEDGIKVLVYAGVKDLICNWLGEASWLIWKLILFWNWVEILCWILWWCMNECDFDREFKVGWWHEVVRAEGFWKISCSDIHGWWWTSRFS